MKCPYCDAEIPDEEVLSESARINGRKSKRKDVPQCPTHKTFLTREGVCTLCAKRSKKKELVEDQGW